MGKHKHFKVKGFLNFWLEAEIHAVPKIWEEWISMVQEKYWKTQKFQIYGFLNPIQDGHFRGFSRMRGGGKKAPLPKICHIYPTMMKLGTVIPYLKKIQKNI